MATFLLRSIDRDMVLDIPGGDAAELKPVLLYGDGHGGENQLWQVIDSHIVSVLNTDLCLGALNLRDGEPVILVGRASDKAIKWEWGNDNTIVSANEHSLQIGPTESGHGIALQKVASSKQLWKKEQVRGDHDK